MLRATMSTDGTYRYIASKGKGGICFVVDYPRPGPVEADITVARCEAIAREMDHESYSVVALYAYPAETEADLVVARRTRNAIIGPSNEQAILHAADSADEVVVAWGAAVAAVLPETTGWRRSITEALGEFDPKCFGTVKGHPVHVHDLDSLKLVPFTGVEP